MICKNCGMEVNNGSEFCPKCGTKVQLIENSTKKTEMDRLSLVTIILFAVQAASYLCHIIFSKVSINNEIMDLSMGMSAEQHEKYSNVLLSMGSMKLKMLYFYQSGQLLLIISVILVLAMLLRKRALLKTGIIIGVIASIGLYFFATIPYIVFFILLLLIMKGKRIPVAIPVVLEVIGSIILSSSNVTKDLIVSLQGLYFVGLIAGTVAFALLTAIINKNQKLKV